MNKNATAPSRAQGSSQASFLSTVTQKNKRNRLSLTQSKNSANSSIIQEEVKQPTDVLTTLLSPPKVFSQAAVAEINRDANSSCSVYRVDRSVKDDESNSWKEETPQFCPTCQMPFANVRILPSVHAAQCDVILDELPECSRGENCSSSSVFHYRDYAHSALAKLRAVGKFPVAAQKTIRASPKVQEVKKKLTFDDSDCNSSSTKSFNWLLKHSRSKLCCDRPVEFSGMSDVNENNSDPEGLHEERKLSTTERSFVPVSTTERSFVPVLVNINSTGQGSVTECQNELRTQCSNDNEPTSAKNSWNGHVETRRVPCEDACFEALESKSDDGVEKPMRAVVSVVLSPDKGSKAVLDSPVKIKVACSNDGWEEVGFESCSMATVGSVKVTVCECSKNMQVNYVVGDTGSSGSSSNFKVLARTTEGVQCCAVSNHTYSDKDSEPNIITSSLSSKNITESSSYASSRSVVELNSSIEEHKETTVNHAKILSAKDQWQQIMPQLRDKKLQASPLNQSIVSSSSISTGRVYKSCPFYKKIPDTSFAVDAFNYGPLPGITTYFLTHFHADHYGGLRKSFNRPIYCSSITAALVKLKLRVDEKYLRRIDVDETRPISDVLVTALDANHCPGSLMFLFQLKDGRNFLHVGDFRADPKMESYPCFWNITIDRLYLDTTYCHPKHTFPPQCEMIAKVLDIVSSHVSRLPKTLIVCGTYTIGKEKVFMAVAELLNCKLWARADKRKVLECIKDPDITERLTCNASEAQVHVCPMADINFESLSSYLSRYKLHTNILAFKPSGWELKAKGSDVNCVTRGNITICGIPYSEHSSFAELKRFVKFIKPKEVFPTVNLSSLSTMKKYFKEWLSENPLKRSSEETSGIQAKLTKYIVRQKSSF